MAKGNLTLGESKTKGDLTLESKDVGITWEKATGTWKEQKGKWAAPKITLTKESKTKDNLTLESK